MGEGNHLTGAGGSSKGRFVWVLSGGAAMAIVAAGLLMQYGRGTTTQAAAEAPAGTAKVASKGPKSDVMARVGDETISYDAVADEAVKRFGREVLDDLIHRLIIQQACEKNKITVTETEINDEITRIAKRFNLDTANWLQMLQAERNISPLQYRQSVIFPMIALRKLAGEDIEITEDELKQAFIRNYGPRVKARMIMFNNLRQAQSTQEELSKDPEKFEEVATKISIEPGSRALGGQIPPIAKFSGNSEMENVEKAAFKLAKDDISGVIEIPQGRYVILKCEGKTEPVVTNIDDVKDSLYEELKESKTQANVAVIFKQIKEQTIVDNYLTQTSNRPEKTAGGTGGSGKVQPASATQTKATSAQGKKPGSTPQKSATSPSKADRK